MTRTVFVVFALFVFHTAAHAQSLVSQTSGTPTSIRGLSVVDDQVAWASGSQGWFGRTDDGGKTWHWQQPAGFDTLDFRDIEGFSAQRAIAVSAGSPAVILLTEDGGAAWRVVYRNDAPDIFLDGMDFWNDKTGMIYGDPIDGRMQLLKTVDGGITWTNISDRANLQLEEGEASFAASGTNIRTLAGGHVWIATGGKRSRIFYSADYGGTWISSYCPIIQGESSTGPFSLAFLDPANGVAAGGNYLVDTLRTNTLVLTRDGGRNWISPQSGPYGYRSSVEYLRSNFLVATGTSGTDISLDGGNRWHRISLEGFHVVRRSKQGSLVLLAGSNGRISTLKL
ncbi:MAG TPA: oxidoreductase [Sphingobacteriaceae bacterium]